MLYTVSYKVHMTIYHFKSDKRDNEIIALQSEIAILKEKYKELQRKYNQLASISGIERGDM